jgi:hypothetical protein
MSPSRFSRNERRANSVGPATLSRAANQEIHAGRGGLRDGVDPKTYKAREFGGNSPYMARRLPLHVASENSTV